MVEIRAGGYSLENACGFEDLGVRTAAVLALTVAVEDGTGSGVASVTDSARCLQKITMNSAASEMAAWSSSRNERPSLDSMASRGRSRRGKLTSTKRTSVHVSRWDGLGCGLNIPARMDDQQRIGRGGDFGTLTNQKLFLQKKICVSTRKTPR